MSSLANSPSPDSYDREYNKNGCHTIHSDNSLCDVPSLVTAAAAAACHLPCSPSPSTSPSLSLTTTSTGVRGVSGNDITAAYPPPSPPPPPSISCTRTTRSNSMPSSSSLSLFNADVLPRLSSCSVTTTTPLLVTTNEDTDSSNDDNDSLSAMSSLSMAISQPRMSVTSVATSSSSTSTPAAAIESVLAVASVASTAVGGMSVSVEKLPTATDVSSDNGGSLLLLPAHTKPSNVSEALVRRPTTTTGPSTVTASSLPSSVSPTEMRSSSSMGGLPSLLTASKCKSNANKLLTSVSAPPSPPCIRSERSSNCSDNYSSSGIGNNSCVGTAPTASSLYAAIGDGEGGNPLPAPRPRRLSFKRPRPLLLSTKMAGHPRDPGVIDIIDPGTTMSPIGACSPSAFSTDDHRSSRRVYRVLPLPFESNGLPAPHKIASTFAPIGDMTGTGGDSLMRVPLPFFRFTS